MRKYFFAAWLLLPVMVSAQQLSPQELQRCEASVKRTTIIRDNWGVPHIYGKTDADVVFGLMYSQCEDNFKGIERNYLYQLGRQGEADGESILYEDIQLQMIADSADAIKEYQTSNAPFKKLLDAFADGINYYLYKHPEVKPVVFHRFEPWFALMFTDGSVSATNTGGVNLNETKQFYGKGPESTGTAWNQQLNNNNVDERETGSNGFALSRSKTASGNTMLYINPHVPFYFRSEVQMVSDEGLNAYGAVTWGQFFIYQGFNAHCGWMHTSSNADVADLYEEKVSQKNNQWYYEYNGSLKPVATRKLSIGFLQDGKMVRRQFTGYLTHHGPVLASRNGKWLSLKANNRSYNALLESWLITKANTFAEYKKAMDLLSNTSNNTVYADDQGNIAFWYGNFIPKRDPKLDWRMPVDGSITATEWKGVHPLDEIVHVYNPATGWIQNCNATPYASSGTASPDKTKYPVYMAPDGQNFRSVNAIQLFNNQDKITTLDNLISRGYDHYLAAFDALLPSLFNAYAQADDSLKQQLAEPIQLLRQWDKKSAANSVATALAVEWGTRMLTGMPRALSSEQATYQTDRVNTMLQTTSKKQQLQYLSDVLVNLEKRFGNWKVQWGEMNRYQRTIDGIFHDDQPSIPVAQTAATFGQLPSYVSSAQNTQKRYGYSGNSFIAAVEFGARVKAKTIMTGGQSFNPTSKHFNDQAEMFLEGKFKDVLFYKEDLMKHVEKTYHPGEGL